MIVHLFNSSSVSGPERLVLPGLAPFRESLVIVNLLEERIGRLLVSDPLEEFCRSLNLSYRSIRVKKRWDAEAIGRLHALLEELHPDLVHAHAIKASIYLLEAGRNQRNRFSIVSTHHGVHGLPDWKTRLYEWLYRKRYLTSFDRVLAVSTPDFEFLLHSGIDNARVRLHLNGIDGRLVRTEDRAEISRQIRAEWLPLEKDRDQLFLFGVVGRLSAEKDHARILMVLSALNAASGGRDWRCLVFGTGVLEQRLKEDSVRLGLENRMIWMGYRNEIGRDLAGLDLLLSFSRAEGLPINVIEAGWAGTPVMATLVGGIQDLLPDDRYGLRVQPHEPPADSAAHLRPFLCEAGRPRLAEWGKNLQDHVTRAFSQQTWTRRLLDIYAELAVRLAGGK